MATKKEEVKREVWYDAAGNQGTGRGFIYSSPEYIPSAQNTPKTTVNIYDTVNTSKNRTGYNDADLAAASSAGETWYTGGGNYSAEDVYSAIQREKDIYNAAMAAGDTAAANAAHQRAEAWRATAGYSGGEDGSEYIRLGGAGIGSMGFTKHASKSYEDKLREEQANNRSGGYMVYYDGGAQDTYTPSAGYEYLKAQAQGINNDADELARQMYVNYMKNTNRSNEMMGLSGLQGSGLQESSLINMGNTYQEQLYRNEQARNESLATIRTEIASMLAAGQITQAEADALYAGIVGGSYDVAAPQASAGGGYAVYYPGVQQQAVNPYAPTMTDAEMYSMLRGLGMGSDVIDTYYTAGKAAPTLEMILAEREALKNPTPVVEQSVVEQPVASVKMEQPRTYTNQERLNTMQAYADRTGSASAQELADYLAAGDKRQISPVSAERSYIDASPFISKAQQSFQQGLLSANAMNAAIRMVNMTDEQRLNEVEKMAMSGMYPDREIEALLRVIGLL